MFQVFIAVENENDNIPLTVDPVYYPTVPENSPAGKVVVELKAEDHDMDPTQSLTFRITAGNPSGFFSINPDTGKKTTEMRILPLMGLFKGIKVFGTVILSAVFTSFETSSKRD